MNQETCAPVCAPTCVAAKDPHFATRLRLTLHSALNTVRIEGIHTRYEMMFLRIAQRWEGTRYPEDLPKEKAKELLEMMHSHGLVEVRSDRYVLTRYGFRKWYEVKEQDWRERNARHLKGESEMRAEYLRKFEEGRLKTGEWRKVDKMRREKRDG